MTAPSLRALSARAISRWQAPRRIDGVVFVGTQAAARISGYSTDRLRVFARSVPGENVVLTEPAHGLRFIRIPRGPDDLRAPIYWDATSLPKRKG